MLGGGSVGPWPTWDGPRRVSGAVAVLPRCLCEAHLGAGREVEALRALQRKTQAGDRGPPGLVTLGRRAMGSRQWKRGNGGKGDRGGKGQLPPPSACTAARVKSVCAHVRPT
jgi:hypothetical protein